jgi:C1A family cysteine protease
VIQSVSKYGIDREESWPYDISKFKSKPPASVYKESLKHLATQYYALAQDPKTIKACLAEGFAVSFGFSVYESFESAEVAKTGVVPMPHPGERILGGHAVLIVGYDDSKNQYIVRNSWGSGWGDHGYCYFHQEMISNPSISNDFWTLRGFTG